MNNRWTASIGFSLGGFFVVGVFLEEYWLTILSIAMYGVFLLHLELKAATGKEYDGRR